MISLAGLGFNGRLGNQMFQYAAGRATSLRLRTELKLQNFNKEVHHEQKCLLSYFNLSFRPLEKADIDNNPTWYNDPPADASFKPEYLAIKDNSILNGHFMDEKYFEDYKSEVLDDFKVSPRITEAVVKNLKQYENPISVHLRVGDMVKDIDLVLDYAVKAMEKFDSSSTFLLLGGGNREEKNTITDTEKELIDKSLSKFNCVYKYSDNTILDLEVMSNCQGNIVSPYSTYSWWAAYRNQKSILTVYPSFAYIEPAKGWLVV